MLKIENMSIRELHQAMINDDLLDTSNYDPSHPFFSERLKANLGSVKDECAGAKIMSACFLKPKCYSLLTENAQHIKKRAKGVQRSVVKAMSHEDHVDVFRAQVEVTKSMRRFQSTNHTIHTVELEKWALSCVDNKRAWIDANTSLPFGHGDLR